MNIVFWLIVVIVLVLIWFCLSFAFKGVGGVGMRLYNDAKKEISEETEKKTDWFAALCVWRRFPQVTSALCIT